MSTRILMSLLVWACMLQSVFGQSKKTYLEANRYDLRAADVQFPQKDFKLFGFASYHGSAKAEEAEYQLMQSLIASDQPFASYLIETDYSTAHFFNQYLATGDSVLLKDLVYAFGSRVPQDCSVEVFQKWKKLRTLKQNELPQLEIVGVDAIANYKYAFMHIHELLGAYSADMKTVQQIELELQKDTIDYIAYYNSSGKELVRNFLADYDANKTKLKLDAKEQAITDYLIKNLELTLDRYNREETIYNNYMELDKVLAFSKQLQFVRYGFFHLEKEREHDTYPPFFARLIDNKVFKREEMITVMGYFTQSEVLWEVEYDQAGNYKSYKTEAGYGISDYWREYFKGIKNFKKTQVSDMTLYRLNAENTPYADGQPDMIEIKMIFSKSNKKQVKGKSTTDFIDYALLISDSPANQPLEILD